MLCYYVVLNAGKNTKLTLNNYAVCVCVLNYLLCKSDVILKGVVRAVDHN